MAPLQSCCWMSLRAGTITLASLNLIYALFEIFVMVLAAIDEQSLKNRDSSGELDEHEAAVMEEMDRRAAAEHMRQFRDEYRALIITIIVFSVSTVLLMLSNVISLSVLIYGAAKSRTRCVRQWLYIGGAAMANDVLCFLAFLGLGMEMGFAAAPLINAPLTLWLWIVAWSLSERCAYLDKMNAEAPRVTMAALVEKGEVGTCTVAYDNLS